MSVRMKSKAYPSCSLDETINFISQFKDLPLVNSVSKEEAAKFINISKSSKSFTYPLSSARYFGLIKSSEIGGFMLTEIGKEIIYPSEPKDILLMYKKCCFLNPKLYSELAKKYNGKSVPNSLELENTLIANHGILKSVVKEAVNAFISSAHEVEAIENDKFNFDFSKERVTINDNNSRIADDPRYLSLLIPLDTERNILLYTPKKAKWGEIENAIETINYILKKAYENKN